MANDTVARALALAAMNGGGGGSSVTWSGANAINVDNTNHVIFNAIGRGINTDNGSITNSAVKAGNPIVLCEFTNPEVIDEEEEGQHWYYIRESYTTTSNMVPILGDGKQVTCNIETTADNLTASFPLNKFRAQDDYVYYTANVSVSVLNSILYSVNTTTNSVGVQVSLSDDMAGGQTCSTLRIYMEGQDVIDPDYLLVGEGIKKDLETGALEVNTGIGLYTDGNGRLNNTVTRHIQAESFTLYENSSIAGSLTWDSEDNMWRGANLPCTWPTSTYGPPYDGETVKVTTTYTLAGEEHVVEEWSELTAYNANTFIIWGTDVGGLDGLFFNTNTNLMQQLNFSSDIPNTATITAFEVEVEYQTAHDEVNVNYIPIGWGLRRQGGGALEVNSNIIPSYSAGDGIEIQNSVISNTTLTEHQSGGPSNVTLYSASNPTVEDHEIWVSSMPNPYPTGLPDSCTADYYITTTEHTYSATEAVLEKESSGPSGWYLWSAHFEDPQVRQVIYYQGIDQSSTSRIDIFLDSNFNETITSVSVVAHLGSTTLIIDPDLLLVDSTLTVDGNDTLKVSVPVPAIPDSVNNYVLKCVAGVLTWVQEV